MAEDYEHPETLLVRLTTAELLGEEPSGDESEEELGGPWLHSDVPQELAQVLVEAYGEESLQKLADEALKAAVKEMIPSPDYATVQAKTLAMDALRYALGIKTLPTEEGER